MAKWTRRQLRMAKGDKWEKIQTYSQWFPQASPANLVIVGGDASITKAAWTSPIATGLSSVLWWSHSMVDPVTPGNQTVTITPCTGGANLQAICTPVNCTIKWIAIGLP